MTSPSPQTPVDPATWVDPKDWKLFDENTWPSGAIQLRVKVYRSLRLLEVMEMRVVAEFWQRVVSESGAVDFERTPISLCFKSDLRRLVDLLVEERLAEMGRRG